MANQKQYSSMTTSSSPSRTAAPRGGGFSPSPTTVTAAAATSSSAASTSATGPTSATARRPVSGTSSLASPSGFQVGLALTLYLFLYKPPPQNFTILTYNYLTYY